MPGVVAIFTPSTNFVVVGLADLQIAAAGLDVLGQHFHAAHEIFAASAVQVVRRSSGLVSRKFDGDSAPETWRR